MTTIRRLLPASGIRKIFDLANELKSQGREILSLDVGRPDYPMPASGIEAAKKALDAGLVHYVTNRGIPELLALLSETIEQTTTRRFDPKTEIVTTTGASEALLSLLMALVGPGDEVIIPTPAWHHYHVVSELAGATVVPLATDSSKGFVIDLSELERSITARTKLIILMNPGNPTGAVQPVSVLKGIAEIATKKGIFVFSDEAYEHFVYDGESCSIGRFMGNSPLFIHCGTFSKSYAMTGWRIGYLGCCAEIADAANRVHQHNTVCGVSFAQYGAVAVLKDINRARYLNEMRSEFKARRAIWLDALSNCKPGRIQIVPPKGAFYLFPKIINSNGEEFSRYLLEKVGLSTVPGHNFGKGYEQHIRISYGGNIELQRKAAQIFVEAINAKN